MKKEERLILEKRVEEMLSNLFNSGLVDEDIKWDEDKRFEESKEEKCLKLIRDILNDRINY